MKQNRFFMRAKQGIKGGENLKEKKMEQFAIKERIS